MASGKMMYKRARVQRLGIMDKLCIAVTSRMAKRRASVSSTIKGQSTRVNSSRVSSTAKGNITMLKAGGALRAHSKIPISRRDGCFLMMDPTMKAIIRQIRCMERGQYTTKMEMPSLVSSIMIKSMAQAAFGIWKM